MFAEQGRTRDLGGAVRHLDGIADREVFAALGMIHFNHGAGGAQRLILDQLLHRQDRAAGDVVLVKDLHRLELGLGHGPLFDAGKDFVQPRQPRRRLGVVGVGLPAGLADDVANLLPNRRLGDEVDVGIGIGLPALAFQDATRLTAAGIVAGARYRVAERNPFAVLAVLRKRAMGEALLIAQLDAGEVEHAILHGSGDLLTLAGHRTLIKCSDDTERQIEPGAAVADLRAGDQRQAVAKAGGRSRAAGALRDVFIHFAVFVRTGAESLDRGHNQFWIDALNLLPRKSHAIEHAGAEILHQHVAFLHQRGEDFLALGILGVERDRALVVVEHGEIQAVDIRLVLQLTARDIANAWTLDLDHVGAEPCQQLRASRSRLDVRKIENANALQRLCHITPSVNPMRPYPRTLIGSCLSLLAKHALRIEVADAAALRAGRRVDHRVDQRGLAGVHGLVHGAFELVRRRRVHANTVECLHHLVVARVLDEHSRRNIRTAGWIDVGPAIDAVVVEDDDADRQVVAADGFDFHAGEPEGAVAFHRKHGLAGLDRSGDRKAHADAHDAPGADVQALARLVHVDDAAREIERIGAFVDEDGVRPLLDDGPQCTERAVVIHRRLVVHQPRRHLGDVFFALRIDGADPVGRRGGPVAAHRFKQSGYAGTDVADHGSCNLDI